MIILIIYTIEGVNSICSNYFLTEYVMHGTLLVSRLQWSAMVYIILLIDATSLNDFKMFIKAVDRGTVATVMIAF